MPDIFIQSEMEKLMKILRDKGFNYLKVDARGTKISIFSEFEGERENRCRFSKIKGNSYELSVSNHSGKWESTPFEGTIEELFDMVSNEFGWVLIDYNLP